MPQIKNVTEKTDVTVSKTMTNSGAIMLNSSGWFWAPGPADGGRTTSALKEPSNINWGSTHYATKNMSQRQAEGLLWSERLHAPPAGEKNECAYIHLGLFMKH